MAMATQVYTLQDEPSAEQQPPRAVWALGLLCVTPCILASAIFCYGPARFSATALQVLFAYSTAMLGYLGGVRAGIEVERPKPRFGHLALSGLAPLIGFGLLLAQNEISAAWRLGGFIAAIVLQWLWDVQQHEGPAWRPRLRTLLALGAGVPLAFALEQALHL